MKITRLIHSCLLIEDARANILVDPGNFSWDDDQVEVENLPKIDFVLITHKHADHCEPKFVQAILNVNPDVIIIGNDEVVEELARSNIKAQTNPPAWIEMTTLKHSSLWRGMPELDNTVFTLWGDLTIFGDNQQLDKVNFADTVIFPIVAPWGSLVETINYILDNPPKRVIPVHDWHLSELGQQWYYQRMADTLPDHGIEFMNLKPTGTIDL